MRPPSSSHEKKIILATLTLMALSILIGLSSFYLATLFNKTQGQILIEHLEQNIEVKDLKGLMERQSSSVQTLLLTGDPKFYQAYRGLRRRFLRQLDIIDTHLETPEGKKLYHEILRLEGAYAATVELIKSMSSYPQQTQKIFADQMRPYNVAINSKIEDLLQVKQRLYEDDLLYLSRLRSWIKKLAIVIAASSLLLGLFLFLFIFKVLRDLRSFHQQLLENEKNLQAALRGRDHFLSMASHELKTPLTSLLLKLQLAQRKISQANWTLLEQDNLRLFLESNVNQVRRLQFLIDEMLDISRIEHGKLELKKEEGHFSRIIKDAIEKMDPQVMEKGRRIALSIHGDAKGVWDFLRLEQVLINLLSNAIKYGEDSLIEVKVTSGPGTVRCMVQDHGPGIDPAFQQTIFERFEIVPTSLRKSGLGLGLYISKSIVELHQGRIWVESELGKGTKFFVELPINTEEASSGLHSHSSVS